MMMPVLFATSETCSVLGTWGFNLCMIRGFGFVVVFLLLQESDTSLCFL